MRNFAIADKQASQQKQGSKLKLSVILAVLILAHFASATESANNSGGRRPASATTPLLRKKTASGTSTQNATSPTSSINQAEIGTASANSIENSATTGAKNMKKGSGVAKMASIAAYGTSAVYMGMYVASCSGGCSQPHLTKAIIFAVAGMAIGKVSKNYNNKSKEFNTAAIQVRTGGNGVPDLSDDFDLDGDGDIDNQDRIINDRNDQNVVRLQRQLREHGVTINPNTGEVRMPDGRTFNASDLSSTAAMRAAGLTSSEITALQDATNKSLAQANAATDSTAATPELFDGNIGSGGGGGNAGMGSDETFSLIGSGAPTAPPDRRPASVQGLQRDYNGEPIGVAGDSLFLMMQRRYDFHESQGSFRSISP